MQHIEINEQFRRALDVMERTGQTLHSFFGFKPDITPPKVKRREMGGSIYKKLDILVIDEISMVRSDLLDCGDDRLPAVL